MPWQSFPVAGPAHAAADLLAEARESCEIAGMQATATAGQGVCRIFDIDLDAILQSSQGPALEVLDEEEHRRASRMATPLLRRRFVAAHAATRQILGNALDMDPARLRFERGLHGKPVLAKRAGQQLHFNLSHCRGRALLAIADTEVGIDIEGWIERDTARLAADVLSPNELSLFGAVAQEDQPRELARLWAAKEALLKACGLGLQLDPHGVPAAPGGGWHTLPAPAGASPWWLQEVDVLGPFCAYVACTRQLEPSVVCLSISQNQADRNGAA